MKKILLLSVVVIIFSCVTSKKNTTNKFIGKKELDSVAITSHFKDFSVKIPKNWFAFVGGHGVFSLSPRDFLNGMKTNRSFAERNVYLAINKSNSKHFKNKNLDEVLKKSISLKKKHYINFKYKVVFDKHPKYGKYFTLKYGVKGYRNQKTTIFQVSYVYKKNYYSFFFFCLNKYYDLYINDVASIINSFQIKIYRNSKEN